MRLDIVKRRLYVATYTYLALPYLIFFGGWLRQPYSTVFVLVIIAALFACVRATGSMLPAPERRDTWWSMKTVSLVLLPVLFVALLSGAGGWGFQSPLDSDWYKHNSILRDLVTDPWPVVYEVKNVHVMLTYYVAYQLPAALVGKLWGWQAANHALFLYSLIGLCLSALWVMLLTGARRWWFIAVFLAFSGMDLLGQIYSTLHSERSVTGAASILLRRLSEFRHLEWWAGWGFAQFSSMAALINMVPNQAIPGWLLTSLALADARSKVLHTTGLFYLGLCVLWAPFVALGLIPLIGFLVICQWRRASYSADTLRQAASLLNVAGVLLGGMVAVYFAGRYDPYVLPVAVDGDYREHITLTFRRIPDEFVRWYVLFVGLEFALLHGSLLWYIQLQKAAALGTLRGLLVLSSCILFALPILNWGWNNKPAMRSSIPALFVTVLMTIQVLDSVPATNPAKWLRRAIWGIVLLGGLNAAVEYGRQLNGVHQQGVLVSVPKPDGVRTIFEIQEEKYRKYYNFAAQYVGSADSMFSRYFGRQQKRETTARPVQ